MKKSVRAKLIALIHKYERTIDLLEYDEELAIKRHDFFAASKFQIRKLQLKHLIIDLENLLK